MRGLKALTTKPVVGVGRFTSPDTMVRMIRDGVLDMIGAARPSIADPFLPDEAGGGPLRGHPRVHRLQHLRVWRLHDLADPLHPEPEHGRGVAPRLAPGADPPQPERCAGAGGGRRAGRPGGGDDARPPRLRGGAGRGRRRAGRAGGARGAAAGAGGVDPGAGLPQGAAGAAWQRRAGIQQHARQPRRSRPTASTTWPLRPAPPGGGTASPAGARTRSSWTRCCRF